MELEQDCKRNGQDYCFWMKQEEKEEEEEGQGSGWVVVG